MGIRISKAIGYGIPINKETKLLLNNFNENEWYEKLSKPFNFWNFLKRKSHPLK